MKIIYFGTPHFAAEVLKYLIEQNVDIAAVVTQPDRPKGRSLQLTPSPVKQLIQEKQIPLFQPEKASQENFLQELAALNADLFVVVAFGQILSQKLLDIPVFGCINVHASLLPKYRGAAPIQRAIMAGEKETGIAIQKMVRQLDAGDVIAVEKVAIGQDMTFGELEEKLIQITKPLLWKVVQQQPSIGHPQDHTLATYASKIEPAEGEIHWARTAQDLHNLVRAFSPRPGAWVWISIGGERKKLKIIRTQLVEGRGQPGELLANGAVACGSGALKLIEVQPEGKRVMNAADWLRGQKNISFIL